MAISLSSTKKTVFGNKKVLILTATAASGDTAGTLQTGLSKIDFAIAQYIDAAKVINCEENSSTAGQIDIDTEDPAATKTFTVLVIGH